jgi:DNA repair exonuclease SbcCD nuclease subunit
MLRIATGDIHLSEYKTDKIIEDNYPRRLYEIILTLKKLCEYARKNNIKNIDLLGDLHSDKNIIYTDAQNAFKKILDDNSDLTFTIFDGNHDLSSTGDGATSTIEVFNKYPNVKFFTDKPVKIGNITILPYSHNMIDYLNELDSNDILLSHFGLSEAVLQSGISIVSSICMKDLAKFKLVLLGHYHKPQELKNDKTRLFYVGCPVHFNWNDKNEKKRFLVYNDETCEVSSIDINWITQFREYVIDKDTDYNSLFEEVKAEKEKGNKVRVRGLIKLDKDQLSKLVREDISIINEISVNVMQRGININMTRDEKFKKYLSYKEIHDTEHDEYINIMKSLLAKEKITEGIEPTKIIVKEEKKKEVKKKESKIEIKEEKKIEMLDDDLELNI